MGAGDPSEQKNLLAPGMECAERRVTMALLDKINYAVTRFNHSARYNGIANTVRNKLSVSTQMASIGMNSPVYPVLDIGSK
jgi:hypothetical protein